jgi:hypothetical protein
MFWSHREQLKEELRLRLRVAADFATLGAYEVSGSDDGSFERPVREEPPQRVFLFAKVAPVCPHSAPAERACSERRSAKARSWGRSTGRQRGGAVRAPEQPCMCPVERVPSA